jgi:hypothetical protein
VKTNRTNGSVASLIFHIFQYIIIKKIPLLFSNSQEFLIIYYALGGQDIVRKAQRADATRLPR